MSCDRETFEENEKKGMEVAMPVKVAKVPAWCSGAGHAPGPTHP